MGQPRNRLTMFLIALLIAVAAAQNNYTIVNLYGNTACTGTPTATYTSNVTFTTVVTTTPTQYQCRTCYAQGAVYSPVSPFVGSCGASFLQVSVAVIGLVVAFVAAL